MRSEALLCALVVAAAGAGCDRCNANQDRPTIVEPERAAPITDGHAAAAPAEGSEPPARPRIVHDAPPGVDGFAVEPIAGDWVTFRGDDARSGVREVRGIRQPRVAWSIEVGVQGYANNPIVTADAVYVGSQGEHHNEADERDGVYSIDPVTGAIRWFHHEDNDVNGIVLSDGMIVGGGDGRVLFALDAATGTERWRLEQECLLFHAPVVRDGRVVLMRSDEAGGIAEVDVRTGAVTGELGCFRPDRGAVSHGGDQIFRASDQDLSMFDATGRAWVEGEIATDAWSRTRWAPPLVARDVVIEAVHRYPFSVDGGFRYRPAAVARWRDNGQLIWAVDINDPSTANSAPETIDTAFLRSLPYLHEDRLIWTPTTAGELVAFDLGSGDRIDSVALPDCRKRAFGSIVGTPDMAYYARHDGVVYGFTPKPLGIVWTLGLGLHATAGNDRTHMPAPGSCFADPKNGTALFATPAIGEDGTLYVGSGDGWLYAVRDRSW